MKTVSAPIKHTKLPDSTRGHNLTAINSEGSYCSTQVWDGGSKEAAKKILEMVERGLDENNHWDKPLVRVFVKPMYGEEVYEFDTLDIRDMVLLGQTAEVV